MNDPTVSTNKPLPSAAIQLPDGMASDDARLLYRKTPLGETEVLDRALGLSVGARRLIILIDGQRPISELPSFARQGDLAELLAELIERDLIELIAVVDTPTEEELAARLLEEQAKLHNIKQALEHRFENVLGIDGIVLDARVADCVSLAVFRRIIREAINLLGQRGFTSEAKDIIQLVRSSI